MLMFTKPAICVLVFLPQKEQHTSEKASQYLIGPREELREVILEDCSSCADNLP